MIVARLCHLNRDDRDEPGHDKNALFDIVEKKPGGAHPARRALNQVPSALANALGRVF